MSTFFPAVLERIELAARRAGRDPKSVRLVVVTKGVPAGRIREAVSEGAVLLGENRVQEAIPKIAAIGAGPVWHLIGALQRNKARLAVGRFDLIHSVDRLELAEELSRRAEARGIRQKVLIQVNVSGEAGKHGVSVEEASNLVRAAAARTHLDVEGLMTIPPLPDRPEDSRPYYRSLKALGRTLEKETGVRMAEFSMGMSRDFEVAIEEGATLVRVGTAVFGQGG
jgi:pyridoxal phosphate enzyme (YggS family)